MLMRKLGTFVTAIYGIWFYKAKECEELGGLMDR